MQLTKMVNGEVIELSVEEEAEVVQQWANAPKDDPVLMQLRHYPDPSTLFSMLWDSMDSGEVQKSEEFYNVIKSVKDKYPPPQGG
jgi:hypothetical protein